MSADTDRRHLWHPYAGFSDPPPVNMAVAASGTGVTLDDGAELVDGISSWWCAAWGHRRTEIVEAVRRQALELPHVMFAGFTHRPAVELADRLLEVLPAGLDRIFFADSGSIAVECAAKMAIQYQQALGRNSRCRLAALRGGYHGDTFGAMALSDPDGMHARFRGMLPVNYFADRPRSRFGGEWDEHDFDSMERVLDEHGTELAAVIVEPIFQGANGMWFYHPEYLRRLRRACDARDILLIFDEIATGFWRTGERFAQHYAGVTPDLMTIGKILTGGVITLGAAVAAGRVADAIPALLHGPTFMANPLACAAGAASMRVLGARDWREPVRGIAERLAVGLEPCRTLPNVRDVRVLGAIGVLEVEHLPPPDAVGKIVRKTGVWLRPFGHWIYTMPPFVVSNVEIDRIADAMRQLAEYE